jgi:opacity protein-like surface antigen
VSYGVEAGLNLKTFMKNGKYLDFVPFVRYEYYNPQEKVIVDANNLKGADDRLKTQMWVAGLNYRPIPNIIIKADYTVRRIGNGKYKSENEFGLGVAYVGWFLKH